MYAPDGNENDLIPELAAHYRSGTERVPELLRTSDGSICVFQITKGQVTRSIYLVPAIVENKTPIHQPSGSVESPLAVAQTRVLV